MSSARRIARCAVVIAASLLAGTAMAQIKVGVTLSATGSAASVGIIERNTIDLWPRSIAGQTVEWIVMDDASEPGAAVRNVRKLTTEDKVDVLIGSTITPNSLAILPIIEETSTPLLTMAASKAVISPVDGPRRWAFKTVHNDQLMIEAVMESMARKKVKRLGYIGLADAGGEGFLTAIQQLAPARGIEVVGIERYNRGDQTVAAQALRLVALHPDAIFVASVGTAAALPQIALTDRGYKGPIYHTHGVAGNDFLRVAGPAAEGVYLPAGPLIVYDQLPDTNPVKAVAKAVVTNYEARYGAGSSSSYIAIAQDALILLQNAVPAALTKAKPGTKEFRSALRDALEQTRDLVGTQGIYNVTPTDHLGLDARSRFIVRVKGGRWVLSE